LSDKFIPVIRIDEIAPGGMKCVELDGLEIVVCNCDGTYYAIQRRCGHMNAPLELGTLDGQIVTCPMHCAQFDVSSGEALFGPVPADLGNESLPPRLAAFMQNVGMLMSHVRTEPIRTYQTKVEAGWVHVAA
jgi:nitrite reductase/ring-hydroxylating ferredoxin subunit